MKFNSLCCRTVLVVLVAGVATVFGGDHGLVDDEIWHHVTKVLSEHEGRGKVLLSHPEPAHLVDAYTKVYRLEPHYDNYRHHAYHNDHPVHLKDDHHHHYAYNPHHYDAHHHHAHAPPAPVFKLPVPVISSFRFGPPPPYHHHYHHHRK